MSTRTINTILTMRDRMSNTIRNATRNTQNMTRQVRHAENQVKRFSQNVKNKFTNVVKTTAKVVTAFAGLAAIGAIKIGLDGLKELDEGSAKVKSIAKNALELVGIKKELIKGSNKTGIGILELADAQYNAISSGVAATDSMKAALTASKLAKAGFTDANSALKSMTSIMNVFGLKGEKAMQSISDKLLVTQNLGVTTVAELAESLGPLTPIANSAGAGIDELMAGMASLTKNGIKTDEAVTAFKGILSSVISPTAEAAKMAKKLGIDFSVSAIKSKGFGKFLEEIKQKTGGNTETMGQLFGNVRALSGALVLTGKGFEDFNVSLDAMKNSAGETDKAYAVMTNTIGHKFNKLKNRIKNAITSIADGSSGRLRDTISNLTDWVDNNEEKIEQWTTTISNGVATAIEWFVAFAKRVKDVILWMREHESVVKAVGIALVTYFAVGKIMAIVKTIQMMVTVFRTLGAMKTFSLLLNPWALLIAAIVAGAYLIYRNWDKIKAKAFELWEGIKAAFAPIKEFFAGLWEGVKSGFKSFINFIIRGVNGLTAPFRSIAKGLSVVPGFGWAKGFAIPEIPTFAKGGIATQPSIFGEAGAEVAIPLKKNNPRSQQLLKQADRAINGGSSRNVNINITIDTFVGTEQFADMIGDKINRKISLALANMA